MKQHDVAGLKMLSIAPGDVEPNPWNPNRMDEATFAKELKSIADHGFIDPITVREVERDGVIVYQIIDGEHRWKAAKHHQLKVIPATNLGRISDDKAKKLTIIYNELKGTAEPALLAKVLKELSENTPIAILADELPMSSIEIDSLIKSAEDYTWEGDRSLLGKSTDVQGVVSGLGTDRKFQLGNVKGTIPDWLAKSLMEEFGRTAKAVRSNAPELVLRDWAARLKATAPVDAPVPPVVPPEAPAHRPSPTPRTRPVPSEGAPTVPDAGAKRRGRKPAGAVP